jgi:predicted  nucleic acid-binding Zn-ribbon protein
MSVDLEALRRRKHAAESRWVIGHLSDLLDRALERAENAERHWEGWQDQAQKAETKLDEVEEQAERVEKALRAVADEGCYFAVYGEGSETWRDCGKCGPCFARAALAATPGEQG